MIRDEEQVSPWWLPVLVASAPAFVQCAFDAVTWWVGRRDRLRKEAFEQRLDEAVKAGEGGDEGEDA